MSHSLDRVIWVYFKLLIDCEPLYCMVSLDWKCGCHFSFFFLKKRLEMWVLRGKKCWVSQLSTKSFFCVCVCVFVSAYCEQSLQGADDVVVLLSVCILNFNYYKTVVCCHVLPIALMLVVLASVL